VSLIPAAFGVAMLFGGLIAGYVISGVGEPALYLIVAICSLVPTILTLTKGKIA
jgi:predicted MFS family arabinose efflux permease